MTLYTQGNVDYQQMKNYKVYLLLSWTLGSFSQFCPSYAHRDTISVILLGSSAWISVSPKFYFGEVTVLLDTTDSARFRLICFRLDFYPTRFNAF